MLRRALLTGASIILAVDAGSVRADHSVAPHPDHRRAHAIAVGAMAALYITSIVAQSELAPALCRWCAPPAIDRDVRAALRWHAIGTADTLSALSAYAALPILTLGWARLDSPADDRWRFLADDLPIVEAVMYSQVLDQVVKLTVARERPYVHFNAPGSAATSPSSERNLSFFSGHTTLAFALAVAAGTVAHDRRSPWEPVVWSAGLVLAVTTGYLRIAADQHYFTDVAVGAVVGGAAGALLPRLLHTLPHDLVVSPTSDGAAISGAW